MYNTPSQKKKKKKKKERKKGKRKKINYCVRHYKEEERVHTCVCVYGVRVEGGGIDIFKEHHANSKDFSRQRGGRALKHNCICTSSSLNITYFPSIFAMQILLNIPTWKLTCRIVKGLELIPRVNSAAVTDTNQRLKRQT